jgi:hypothetical protein
MPLWVLCTQPFPASPGNIRPKVARPCASGSTGLPFKEYEGFVIMPLHHNLFCSWYIYHQMRLSSFGFFELRI